MDDLTHCRALAAKPQTSCWGTRLASPGLPVDRHVLRVSNRIGIAKGDEPEAVEQQLAFGNAESEVDRVVRHPIIHGAADMQAEAALRSVCRARRLQLLPHGDCRRVAQAQANPKGCAIRAKSRGRRRDQGGVRPARGGCAPEIPGRFRDEMLNVAMVVEDEPSRELLDEMDVDPGDTSSASIRERRCPSAAGRSAIPCRIASRSSRTHGRGVANDDEIRDRVAETVIHESATTSG